MFWEEGVLLRAPETMSPFRVMYQAKDDEKQPGEGRGHKIGKMGRRRYGWPLSKNDDEEHCFLK